MPRGFAPFPTLIEFLGDVNGEPRLIAINVAQVISVYPLGTTSEKTGVDVVGGHIRLNEKYQEVKKALIGDMKRGGK
jgi:hypothetical protein